MRVSTSQIYATGVDRMREVQASLDDIQQKVSTGIGLSKPSDDPIAFSQVLKLGEEISINEQYSNNIRSATGRNELADSMMSSAVDALQRLRELGLQASNDTLNQQDRKGIAEEVRILQTELAGILNATNGSGEFIFGGFQGRELPFQQRSGGGYDYKGDEGQRIAQISPSSYVDVSDSGKDIFVNIPSAKNTILTRNSEGNDPTSSAAINVGQVYNQSALDQVYPEKFIVTFGDPAENQNRQTFSVTRASDGTPVVGDSPVGALQNRTYIPGESIDFHGVRVKISGDPKPNDSFFVESSGTQSLMNTLERFAQGLEELAVNPVVIEGTASLVGRASPPRPTLTAAGNYVAQQQLTLRSEQGTVQTVDVLANQSIGDVAAALDALTGVSANFDPAEALLDFSTTAADEGDIIEFNINGIAVQATAGANDSATFANIDAALTAVLPTVNLSYTNEGLGRFRLTQSTGENVAIDDFRVTDFPGVELDIVSGLTPGETLGFSITGSAGEVLNLSYTAVTGDVNELTTQLQTAIAGAGLGASMTVTQASSGAPARIQYFGDIDGDAQITLGNLTDSGTNNVELSLAATAGTQTTDSVTNGAASRFLPTSTINVLALEGRATLGVKGAIGDMVTLRDGGADSSAVAARLEYTLQPGYTLESSIADRDGGLLSTPTLDDTLTLQFRESMNSSLANLDNALNNVTQSRSRIGARLNMLESAQDLNESMTVELKEFQSKIRDLDYAKALTEVQMKTFILQAAQNTFVRVTGLSLFNFL